MFILRYKFFGIIINLNNRKMLINFLQNKNIKNIRNNNNFCLFKS